MGLTPSYGMHKGLVVNINEAKETIREAIKEAEHSSGLLVGSAYVGITGRHVNSFNTKGTIATVRNDRMVTPSDLDRALETARSVEMPPDSEFLHIIPRQYTLEGKTRIKNPVGMHGIRVDLEAHVITAGVASVQNLLKCIRGAGADVEDMILEPLASSEAVLTPEEKEAGVVLADIGGGTADISVFREGSIWHSAILPVAGYNATRDISIGLGIPFEIAEEVKKKHARILMDEEDLDIEDLNVAPGHNIVYRDLCEIIRARYEEILKLILLELPRFNYKSLVPAGLVLTGGSSNLPGLEALGREIFQLSTRIGRPSKAFGIADEALTDPAYATALGLLLWANNHEPGEGMPSQGVFADLSQGLRRFFFRLRRLFI